MKKYVVFLALVAIVLVTAGVAITNGQGGKVTICHIPPGNPAAARTIMVNADSVADHLAHGDLIGPCP